MLEMTATVAVPQGIRSDFARSLRGSWGLVSGSLLPFQQANDRWSIPKASWAAQLKLCTAKVHSAASPTARGKASKQIRADQPVGVHNAVHRMRS